MASAMDGPDILNLSRQHLKKVEPAQGNEHYSALLLDHNEIPRLENVDTYSSLIKLSASHNQLMRMYGVARLYSLRVLNLSHNNIVAIEGLKDMKHLSCLNLAGNNIKSIEHLNSNVNLEILDLSDNAISSIPDLSHMKNLKKLHIHCNKIKTLQFCEKFIAPTVVHLTLADNYLCDLNEISRVAHLTGLENLSITGNPCCNISCDYRPYILNWIPSLKILDELLVNPKESLVAEWLYSQGKGRQFKVAQHEELIQYLATMRPDVCNGTDVEESSSKLDKILNLARQHQGGSDFLLDSATVSLSPTPQRRVPVKKTASLRRQVKGCSSRIQSKSAVLTCDDDLTLEPMPAIMYQSLDSAASLERSVSVQARLPRPASSSSASSSAFAGPTPSEMSTTSVRRTLSAASERKPLYSRTLKTSGTSGTRTNSNSKLPVQSQSAVLQHVSDVGKLTRRIDPAAGSSVAGCRVNSTSTNINTANSTNNNSSDPAKVAEMQAAVTIQKVWRGYQTRNLDPNIKELKKEIRQNRTEDHVRHLSRQMNRLQTPSETPSVAELAATCSTLRKEVNELQTSMQQVLDWIAQAQPVPRPRTLQLTSKLAPEAPVEAPAASEPVEEFAHGMAHRLIQSVSKETESSSSVSHF